MRHFLTTSQMVNTPPSALTEEQIRDLIGPGPGNERLPHILHARYCRRVPLSRKVLADAYGVSTERIRQQEAKGLTMLAARRFTDGDSRLALAVEHALAYVLWIGAAYRTEERGGRTE